VKIIYTSRAVLEEILRRVTPAAEGFGWIGPAFLRVLKNLLAVHPANIHGGAHDVPVRTNWRCIRDAAQELATAFREAGGPTNLAAAKELDDFIKYGDSKKPR
jgi:hypothetical protein